MIFTWYVCERALYVACALTQLRGRLLEISDEVGPILLLLEAREDHLRARDVLLWVDEVLHQCVLAPDNALFDVGFSVSVQTNAYE